MSYAEPTQESTPYEFANYPLDVVLIHRPDSPRSLELKHRVRKPSGDEWVQWARDIKRSRRYLSTAEIEEEGMLDDDDSQPTEVYERSYNEWEASERLYDKIILEIAGYRFEKNDQHPVADFRTPTREMVEKLPFEHKEAVIGRLYECFCSVDESSSPSSESVRVRQELAPKSSSVIVIHALRKPSEEESLRFRTTILQGRYADDNAATINLILNLPAAVELYDKLIMSVENATAHGQPFSEADRDAFLAEINPVSKLRVLEALLDVGVWGFKVDEIKLWVPRW
jgi:hypothetical protein